MTIPKINPENVLFIKLGEKGTWEEDCLTKTQTIRIGFTNIDHQTCLDGKWADITKYYISEGIKPFVATSFTNQAKRFYEEGSNTLWVTFYANKMWWCFAESSITVLPDMTKVRSVIGTWSDKDINGVVLTADRIRGSLLKTQGFRGTICTVPEHGYAVAKINADEIKEVIAVEEAVRTLNDRLQVLIKSLQWKDFEILVDLIFRQAGWQRVGVTGKTAKTLDLDLIAPVTGEKCMVQIKSQSDLREFDDYVNEFAQMTGYDKFFYVVHSPSGDLCNYLNTSNVNLMMIDKITELSISSGLVDWIIKKNT